jgi:hypothetical protein
MFSMMRIAAATVLLFGSASVALAQSDTSKVDISGNWNFTVVYEGGQGTPTVRFVQRGDSLTGKYISNSFGELDLKGTIKGKEFSFQVTTAAGGDPFTMTFSGTVERPDALRGDVDLGGNGSATFIATKAKPGSGAS